MNMKLWWPEITHLKTVMCSFKWKVVKWNHSIYKPVNHWQYSMTSLATPFPSSLTSPSFPPFFSLLPFTPPLSLAFSHSLLLSILHLCPSHLQFLCMPSIPIPSPSSLPHPSLPSCQQLFHNGLSNKHLSSTHLPEVIWEPICLQHCYSYKADYSQQMSLNC